MVRLVHMNQVGDAERLADDPVGAGLESIADRRLIRLEAIRRDFRRTDHTLTQVPNELVRAVAAALAGVVADDRAR